ncbi:hypothetical protein H6783_02265 [Candidatus Nomurabacteria bacterium]|nr:hypothetical protein [Candidatus Nomurabacteria bacterium]
MTAPALTDIRTWTLFLVALILWPVATGAQTTAGNDTVIVDGLPLSLDTSPVTTSSDNWYEVTTIGSEDDATVGDFVVGPGKIEIEIEPGESKTVFINVSNRTGEERVFNFGIEDMIGSDDPSKTIELLGSTVGPYSVQSLLSLGGTSLILKNNERARVPVTITIPPDADPGGHYGSVLVDTVAVKSGAGQADVVTPQSPVVARIGTLFFVTVPGAVDREGSLQEIATVPDTWWHESGPITFSVLFKNTGSVHLAPYGELRITNITGQEVGYVELDPWFAMPGSLRSRDIIWDRAGLFGRYTATVRVNRSYNDIIDEASVTFWVVPWKFIVIAVIVLMIIVLLLRYLFRNFEFKRKDA